MKYAIIFSLIFLCVSCGREESDLLKERKGVEQLGNRVVSDFFRTWNEGVLVTLASNKLKIWMQENKEDWESFDLSDKYGAFQESSLVDIEVFTFGDIDEDGYRAGKIIYDIKFTKEEGRFIIYAIRENNNWMFNSFQELESNEGAQNSLSE